MTDKKCAACESEFDGHGNARYCDSCRKKKSEKKGFEHLMNMPLRRYVAENYGAMAQAQMAREMGVSRQRVSQVARQLGLR